MINKHSFSQHFSKRMLVLSIAIAFIIMASMPLTYLFLSLNERGHDVNRHCRQISMLLIKPIINGSQLPKYPFNSKEFMQELSSSSLSNIRQLSVYNNKGSLLQSINFGQAPLFKVTGTYPLSYNNQTYGSIQIIETIDSVILKVVNLIFLFSILGTVVAVVLYRFPTKIVTRSEENVLSVIKRLEYLSCHDQLTSLCNRMKLEKDLKDILLKAAMDGFKVAILFLDLDRFKIVNDSLGHGCGDILLKQVATRLAGALKEQDIIARQGGDEFIIVMPGIKSIGDVKQRTMDLIETLEQGFVVENHDLYVSASVGISIYPDDGKEYTTLLKHADAAMYLAKQRGKDKFRFYTSNLDHTSSERLLMESGLKRALVRNELVVHYQPIFNLKNGQIVGCEALVRWKHPEKGLLYPKDFIDITEETGLINQLGEWVLKTACMQNSFWQKAGLPSIYMSVNLSAYQFQLRSLERTVIDALKNSGLAAHDLQLEITESAAMYNEENFIRKLFSLKKIGVRLAIDDFGTGYSSLNYLKRFPIDIIKIDKGFVKELSMGSKDAAIVSAILAMARSLSMEVVAEGVETERQRDYLECKDCYFMQGFLFGKPVPPEQFSELLANTQKMAV